MTGYLLAGTALIALAAVAVAGVQSSRLADAQSSLATVQSDLDAARHNLDRIAREKATTERDQAVTREIAMSKLQARIASMAGTAADGPVAPVLVDTIRGLAP